MGSSNRHGGQKISRRLKVMFNGHAGRRDVFRHYFGVKKSTLDVAATGSSGAGAASPSGDAGQTKA